MCLIFFNVEEFFAEVFKSERNEAISELGHNPSETLACDDLELHTFRVSDELAAQGH